MESFLKDYGLKWVGENKAQEGEFHIEDLKKELDCAKPIYKSNLPREIDMNVVVRRIDELNIVMGFLNFNYKYFENKVDFQRKRWVSSGCQRQGWRIQNKKIRPFSYWIF